MSLFSWAESVSAASRIYAEIAEYANADVEVDFGPEHSLGKALRPEDDLLMAYDARVVDPDLRIATRSRYVSEHYADSVEAGVKALNELVRQRSGRTEDGDSLVTVVFSPAKPILRIGAGRSRSDESAQRGHMQLCQGVISAWRNPRAHSLLNDDPRRALMMLETINDLMNVTRVATRTRQRVT